MKLKTVIVDDAPFIRDLFRHILTKMGHLVEGEAEDGEKAVEIAQQVKPDLIIMDIVMPKKSGVQATKDILQILPNTKIIACSTVDQEILLNKAIEAGAHDFIYKPFKAQELADRITALFKHDKEIIP